jgi:RAB11-binding protein RELCH
VVEIVALCLPHIVEGVILKKREELLPVLLSVIRQHPDSKARDALTKLLFNLILRPTEDQRQMIMDGCVALARLAGPERTEIELLPQCWEQIIDRYEERRVLVAQSCGALAPYVRPALVSSLVISILQQLLDDKRFADAKGCRRLLVVSLRPFRGF